jgi:spore coat protein A
VAKRGTPVLFNVTNQLPNKALIPIDPTMMAGPKGLMVGDLPLNRIATHVHGGLTPWFSDGTLVGRANLSGSEVTGMDRNVP